MRLSERDCEVLLIRNFREMEVRHTERYRYQNEKRTDM